VPVLLVTGYGEPPGDGVEDRLIEKPFELQDLLDAVDTLLQQVRA